MPHQAVGFQAGDQTTAAAINATVGIAINGMIEHVEELRLELRVHPLRNGEVLENGHVRQEFSRPGEAVAPNVPEVANAGIVKRAALGNNQLRQWIARSVANERQIGVRLPRSGRSIDAVDCYPERPV